MKGSELTMGHTGLTISIRDPEGRYIEAEGVYIHNTDDPPTGTAIGYIRDDGAYLVVYPTDEITVIR